MSSVKNAGKDKYTAGFKLLDKFQAQWEHIQGQSENYVRKTRFIIERINLIEKSFARRLDALNSFIGCYTSLSKLDDQISVIESDLMLLDSSFNQIEGLLTILRDHKEEEEFKRSVRELDEAFENQIKKLMICSEARKEDLKKEHLNRVEDLERSQQVELDERRKVLEEAFEAEKNKVAMSLKNRQ